MNVLTLQHVTTIVEKKSNPRITGQITNLALVFFCNKKRQYLSNRIF